MSPSAPSPSGILPILDLGRFVTPESARRVTEALLDGGARMIQLRAKTLPAREILALARELVPVTHQRGATLIVNDRPDIARLAGADGVHLGQTDLPASDVRTWLPPSMAIGVSCHNPHELDDAVATGVANYLGVGPLFPTGSKANPDPVIGLAGLAAARARHPNVPLVGIGGITVDRLAAVRRAGATAAAMIAGLLEAPDLTQRMREAVAAWEAA